MLSLSMSISALATCRRATRANTNLPIDGVAALFDASNLSTLFQDAAMTSPVLANGNPVGAVQDLSGNGHHLLQTKAAACPRYRTDGALHWIEGDGVDDILAGSIPVSSYPLTIAVAFDPVSTTGSGIAGFYQGEGVYKSLMINGYLRAVDRTIAGAFQSGDTNSGFPPKTCAIATFADTSSEVTTQDYVTSSAGYTQTFETPTDFRLFSFRNSDRWKGRIYAAAVFNRVLHANEKATLMQWLAPRAGVTL
ncbi:MAG: hypothetical protein EP336_18040 [Rhodobacteraceae bacterium]|nr:MAG: hypothetical protein EP336_18040 [Paracoccaceae bacterium]